MASPFYGLSQDEFLRQALAEDVGDGDHTSLATIDADITATALVKVKSYGVIAGIDVALKVLMMVDPGLSVKVNSRDGDKVKKGDVVMEINGNVRSLLRSERLLLNCMQRMSGIATMTSRFVETIKGTNAKILDTRKTTPNFRWFEKAAVRIGGGFNHRFGLYDMILIKDNHVDASGGIVNALKRAEKYNAVNKMNLQIEIETRNIEEVKMVVESGIKARIMLDNFNLDDLAQAVKIAGTEFETEASGGITIDNVRDYAITGINFISVGALTHSYTSMDINMKITV